MKRLQSMALFCVFSISAFAQNFTSETRNISSFTGLDASSAFTIELKKGAIQSVVIECEPQYLPYIKTEVKNGILKLYYTNPTLFRRVNSKFNAYITIPDLNYLDLSEACTLSTSDLFTPSRFKADLSGASKVNGLRIHTKDVDIDVSGASNLQMEIQCDRATFDFSGASKSTLKGVITQCNLEISGVSRAQWNIQAEKINLEASGASNVTIEGSVNQAKVGISGASTLSADKFIVKEMKISASGASKADVFVTESLSPSLSSSSRLNYQGNPQIVDIKVSSGASINKR